jgi:hypothetical protein
LEKESKEKEEDENHYVIYSLHIPFLSFLFRKKKKKIENHSPPPKSPGACSLKKKG